MRTKALLIAVAALAAGVITSQAQVYSQNIVGYVNTPVAGGFNNVANPLDAADPNSGAVNNSITNLISVFSGNYDGDLLYVWAGTHYTTYTVDSSWASGIGNASDSAQVNPPPVVSPGTPILFDNTIASNTVTFVGTVHVDGIATGTNVIGTTTNVLTTSPVLSFLSSKLPIGGGISSVLQLPSGGVLDGCLLYLPTITTGQLRGFNTITIDSSFPTGFANSSDSAGVPEPIIPVGTGFFFYNTVGPAQWIQNY